MIVPDKIPKCIQCAKRGIAKTLAIFSVRGVSNRRIPLHPRTTRMMCQNPPLQLPVRKIGNRRLEVVETPDPSVGQGVCVWWGPDKVHGAGQDVGSLGGLCGFAILIMGPNLL